MRRFFFIVVLLLSAGCEQEGVVGDSKPGDLEYSFTVDIRSDAFKQRVQEQLRRLEAEYEVIEEAAWFGTTGLGEELERELPHYLRREFGESVHDENSLKARDLEYLGAFAEPGGQTHFWRIPWQGSVVYATIEVDAAGNTVTGWGDKAPPP